MNIRDKLEKIGCQLIHLSNNHEMFQSLSTTEGLEQYIHMLEQFEDVVAETLQDLRLKALEKHCLLKGAEDVSEQRGCSEGASAVADHSTVG